MYSPADILIIQVGVPEQLMKRLSVDYDWYSKEWKKGNWHGRNWKMLPAELIVLDEKNILIGHIALEKHF